jgi:hypothetical protein
MIHPFANVHKFFVYLGESNEMALNWGLNEKSDNFSPSIAKILDLNSQKTSL